MDGPINLGLFVMFTAVDDLAVCLKNSSSECHIEIVSAREFIACQQKKSGVAGTMKKSLDINASSFKPPTLGLKS